MTEIVYLLFGLVFMALCYFIAVEVSPGRIRFAGNRLPFLNQYLFAPASTLKATAGMVGSTISFYITIYSCVSLTFGWGSLFVLALLVAVPGAFFLFYLNVKRVIEARFAAPESAAKPAAESVITYVDLAQRRHQGLQRLLLLPLLLMGVYVIFTVATEMHALQVLYAHMAKPPADILQPSQPAGERREPLIFAYGLFILLACLGYVLRGGYRAIMAIDVMQIAIFSLASLAALLGMCLYGSPDPVALIRDEFVGPGRWGRVIPIFVATCVLILCWFTAALDNWIRIAGAFFDHVIAAPGTEGAAAAPGPAARAAVLRRVRRVLAASTVFCLLLSIVPSLAGLYLRHQAIAVWTTETTQACDRARVDETQHAPLPPLPDPRQPPTTKFLDRRLLGEFLLIPDEGCEPASWLGPKSADRYQVARFAVFTSSPYDLFSLKVADEWQRFQNTASVGARLGWLLLLGVFVVSVICAVVTTVNSYLLTMAQLFHRYFSDAARGARFGWLVEPFAATALAGAVIAALLSTGVMNEANYISFGVMAFGSIMFLAPISALAVWEPRTAILRRALRALSRGYGVWWLLWLVHMWLQTPGGEALLNTGDDTQPLIAVLRRFYPRSFLTLLGVVIAALCVVVAYLPRRRPAGGK